jgi:hypothetical protein
MGHGWASAEEGEEAIEDRVGLVIHRW